MKNNAQLLPVTIWEQEPKLTVLEREGGPLNQTTPMPRRRARPELEVLGWQPRLVRLSRKAAKAD